MQIALGREVVLIHLMPSPSQTVFCLQGVEVASRSSYWGCRAGAENFCYFLCSKGRFCCTGFVSGHFFFFGAFLPPSWVPLTFCAPTRILLSFENAHIYKLVISRGKSCIFPASSGSLVQVPTQYGRGWTALSLLGVSACPCHVCTHNLCCIVSHVHGPPAEAQGETCLADIWPIPF